MPERGQAFQALRESSVREVSSSGFDFRFTAVTPADLVLVTSDYTQHLNIDVRELARVRAIPDPIDRANAALEAAAHWHEGLSPEELSKKVLLMEQLCCASIRAFRVSGAEEFDPVQFVMDEHAEQDISTWTSAVEWQQVIDKKRAPPKLWIGRLPKPCVETLFGNIWGLSGDDGRAQEAIAHFRRQHGSDDARGSDRAPPREVGVRGA
jgi:hypothetical protein